MLNDHSDHTWVTVLALWKQRFAPSSLSNNDPRHEQFVAQGEITKELLKVVGAGFPRSVLQTAATLEEAIEDYLKAKFKPVAVFAFSLASGAKFSDHGF